MVILDIEALGPLGVTVAVVAIVFVSCQLPLWGWQYIDIIDSLVGTKVKVRNLLPWRVCFYLIQLIISK